MTLVLQNALLPIFVGLLLGYWAGRRARSCVPVMATGVGPWLVTSEEVDDPQDLDMWFGVLT
jgi:hypothetical protein